MSTMLCTDELARRACEGCASSALLVPLFEMRRFDFTNLHAGAASNDITIVLCPALRVVDYYRVRLAVRVHALSMALASAQALSIYAYGALPCEEDPTQDFVDQTNSFLRLDISASTTVPSLVTASGTDPDACLRFVLYAQQTTSPTNFTATLSACVLLRKQ